MRKSRSGAIFFTLDTMIAGLIIIVTLILVLSIQGSSPIVEDTYQELANYVNFITTTTMKTVRNDYSGLYDNPYEKDLDLYVYQKVLKLYDEGNSTEAENLIGNLSLIFVPEHFGFEYALEDTVVYSINEDTKDIARTGISHKIFTFVEVDGTFSVSITNITMWS